MKSGKIHPADVIIYPTGGDPRGVYLGDPVCGCGPARQTALDQFRVTGQLPAGYSCWDFESGNTIIDSKQVDWQ